MTIYITETCDHYYECFASNNRENSQASFCFGFSGSFEFPFQNFVLQIGIYNHTDTSLDSQ